MTDASKTKIISRKVEFEGWHKLETIVLQHASLRHDGHVEAIKREMYFCGTCVVTLLYQPETDQILMNEQFRIGAYMAGEPNPWLYECCAGMIDEDEEPEAAVRREALEETGCPILDLEFIGKVYTSPGGTDEKYMLYCGRIGTAEAGHYGVEEEGEEIKTHLVSAAEAINMLDRGKIINSGTVMCLQWFARNHDRLREKMESKIMSALITATELNNVLQQPHVKVLDASYNLPPSPIGIPGAQDFNIDDVADPISPFAHTVPTEEIFADKVRALGIGNNDLVVVYDRGGIAMAASRAWWMFRLFGHDNVKILNGGLSAWTKAGNATAKKSATAPAPALFMTKFRPELLKKTEQIVDNLLRKDFTVLDARDSKRFEAGHIPGSLSIPYAGLVDATGALKPQAELEKAFKTSATDLQKNITCSCGSGVTACVVALALHELGHKNAAVYDGSWTEWGASALLPKLTGTA